MSIAKSSAVVCLAACLGMGTPVLAGSWTCEQGGLIRTLDVSYPEEPAPLPCSVNYGKPSEGAAPRALWTSRHEEGFCERQAEAFLAKLSAWGWQCAASP